MRRSPVGIQELQERNRTENFIENIIKRVDEGEPDYDAFNDLIDQVLHYIKKYGKNYKLCELELTSDWIISSISFYPRKG